MSVIARADVIQTGDRCSVVNPQPFNATAFQSNSLKEANQIGTLTAAATPSEWLCPFDTQP